MRKAKLTTSEKQSLSNISDVLHANPFSNKRLAVDQKIADFQPEATYTERYAKLIEAVSREVNRLASEGKGNIRMFEGRDRALVEEALVYHVHNQFFSRLDTLFKK